MVIAILLAASFLCVTPALAEEPSETYVIEVPKNAEEDRINTEFFVSDAISAAKTNSGVVQSAMDVDAIALTTTDKYAKWTPSAIKPGVYEIWTYNVGAVTETEKWRNTSTQVKSNPYVQYTIHTAVGSTVCYVNQGTGVNGWISLGTYAFSGQGGENVVVTQILNPGNTIYTYVGDMKFVPVTADTASLMHTYAFADGTAVLKDSAAVTGNHIVKQIPSSASNYKIELQAFPGNTITVDGSPLTVNANGVYSITGAVTAGTTKLYTIEVENSSSKATYTLTVDMEGSTVIETAKEIVRTTTPGGIVQYAPTIETAGYYNVYVNVGEDKLPYFHSNYSEKMMVSVWHSGLREDITVNHGLYAYQDKTTNAADAMWVYAGKYYFSGVGSHGEKIVVSNIASAANSALTVQGVKLVAAAPDEGENPFRGIAILDSSGSIPCTSSTAEAFGTEKTYMEWREISPFKLIPVMANTEGVSIKINGYDAEPNTIFTGYNTYVGAGETGTFKIVVQKENRPAETYTLYYNRWNQSIGDCWLPTWDTNTEISGTISDLPMLVSHAGTTVKAVSSEDGYIMFKPSVSEPAAYKVIAWRPAFPSEGYVTYGSKEQPVEIKTTSGIVNTTVDWKSTPSMWVDLGIYALGEDSYIKFTKASDADYLLANTIILSKRESTAIDDTLIVEEMLNDYLYMAEDDNVNISASFSDFMKINGEAFPRGEVQNIQLSPGVNTLSLEVYSDAAYTILSKSFTIKVLCNRHIVGQEESEVVKTGDWSAVEMQGYKNDRKAIYAAQAESTIFFPISKGNFQTQGDFEVLVYSVAGSADMSAQISTGGEAATVTVPGNQADWVSLGTYTFTGAANEGITLTTGSSTAYADAVCFRLAEEYTLADTTLVKVDNRYTAKFTGNKNTEGTDALRVMVAVYSGNQMKDIVVENKNVSCGLFKISDISIAASEGDTVKAFLWKDMVPVCGAVTAP